MADGLDKNRDGAAAPEPEAAPAFDPQAATDKMEELAANFVLAFLAGKASISVTPPGSAVPWEIRLSLPNG
jgi:hypothetical protein